MTASRPIFVLVMYGGQWKYDVDAKEYKCMTDKCGWVIHVEPDCIFEQLVRSVYRRFNISLAEKSVVLNYKL